MGKCFGGGTFKKFVFENSLTLISRLPALPEQWDCFSEFRNSLSYVFLIKLFYVFNKLSLAYRSLCRNVFLRQKGQHLFKTATINVQHKYLDEHCIIVDENDKPLRSATKRFCHSIETCKFLVNMKDVLIIKLYKSFRFFSRAILQCIE